MSGRSFRCAGALILLAALPGAAAADADSTPHHIGRLFLTVTQRAQIDAIRGQPAAPETAAGPTDTAAASSPDVFLNGVLIRGSGDAVVWIDGRPVPAGSADTVHEVRVRRGPDRHNRVVLESRNGSRRARLKPGQTWNQATGRVSECRDCDDQAAAAIREHP